MIIVHPKPDIPWIYFTGLYPNFTVDKSLTIIAEEGVLVRCKRPTIRDLGPNDRVVIRGIQFERAIPAQGAPNIRLENNQGTVWLEDCVFRISTEIFQPLISVPPIVSDPAVEVIGPIDGVPGTVTFVRCDIQGTDGATDLSPSSISYGFQMTAGVGLYVERAFVALWDCQVTGGTGQPGGIPWGLPGGPGGDAVTMDGGFLFASNCTVAGGDGGFGIPAGGGLPCVRGGDGGSGVVLTGASSEMIATTRSGGAPGAPGGTCPGGSFGSPELPSGAVVDLSGAAFTLAADAPRREDQSLELELGGPSSGLYLVDIGFDPLFQQTPFAGLVQGVLHIQPSPAVPIHPSFFGQLPTGTISLPLAGALAGQQGEVIFLQAVGLDPLSAGVWIASSPTAFVLLAAGL